jgi:dipeptidyl aminopeptidase/acylaminoacyl peptidase
MPSRTTRLAWSITALVAVGLLLATVALARRERALAAQPGTGAVLVVEADPVQQAPAEAVPSSAALPQPQDAVNGLIAFTSDRDGNSEIYVIQPDGSEATRITDDPARDVSPYWTYDGSHLAWLRGEDSNGNGEFQDGADSWSLMLARPDGSEQRVLYGESAGWLGSAGADRRFTQLALLVVHDDDGDGEIGEGDGRSLLLVDLQAAEAEPVDLLADRPDLMPSGLQQNFPIPWAPDGTTLYAALEAPTGPGFYGLPAGGGEPTLLLEGAVQQAALSPNGSHLAAWMEVEDTGRRRQRMLIYDLEAGQSNTLLMGGLGLAFISDLNWSPDGTRLLFMGSTGASAPEVYSLDVAQDALTSLTQRVASPAFTPAWAPDGAWAVFVVQDYRPSGQGYVPSGNADLFLADDLGAGSQQLTQDQGNNTLPAWQPVFP